MPRLKFRGKPQHSRQLPRFKKLLNHTEIGY